MNSDTLSGIFMLVFGAILVVHCPRAAVREYRSGIGLGRYGAYPRETRPFRFWMTIVGTVAAGLMGVGFSVFGVLTLAAVGIGNI